MLQKTLSSGLYILHDIVILLTRAQLINAIKWPLELLARDFGFCIRGRMTQMTLVDIVAWTASIATVGMFASST